MSASSDDFSSSDDDSSNSFDELEFMKMHMNEIGDELYEKRKMLAKAQANATLDLEIKSKIKG
jgi:hypothetical protein